MAEFLLEIGTEEVPASAVAPALRQLATDLPALLARERISFGSVEALGSPRRMAVRALDVAGAQSDATLEHRGPARAAAFDAEGRPTRAAEGFARKWGLSPGDLEVREVDGAAYVFARQHLAGRPTAEVLSETLPGLLAGLQFPKFMRWGEGGFRFSRPIRWLVALLDDRVVEFEAAGIRSGRTSRGHRFLPVDGGGAEIPLASAGEYREHLRSARVLVDAEERRHSILAQGNRLAAERGVRVVWDEELLDEVVYVVEYPTLFTGAFDPSYLVLPRPVLVSAMRKHQRYFTLEELDGSLAPLFLTARNGDAEGLEIVRAGNERVLAFRFNDAVHHYNEDLKTTLQEKRARLSRVVFMQRLGSMLDRSERLERLVTAWCRRLGRDDLLERAACAAHLSKADLASQMVAELPELQGVMGREYGVLEGLDPAVAQAIGEQYMPKTAGDPLPQSEAGRLLALADRIDLLIAALSLGHAPTGSSDPFGLRRAAAGVTALLAEMPPSLAPAALVEDGLAAFREEEYYRASSPRPGAEVAAGVLALLTARLEAQLLAEGVRRDLADAVLNGRPGSVPSLLGRARFLRSRLSDPSWEPVSQSATRIRNILRPTDGAPEELDPARLEQPEEQALHAAVEAAAPELDRALAALNWEAAWARWAALAPAITTFFDEVLVNAPDPELAAARRGLLRRLDAGFLAVADFSRTVDLQAAE